MVHGYDGVELPPLHAGEDGVARDWADQVEALRLGSLHRGAHLSIVLVAKEPVLAAVGVQAGDGDAKAGHPGTQKGLTGDADDRQDALSLGALDGLAHEAVGRNVADAQVAGDQRHRHILDMAHLGQ
jgi:hypothetical protein